MDPSPLGSDELKPRPGSTTASRNRHRLILGAPRRHYLPGKPRSRLEIPAAVREAILACCEARSPWPLLLWGTPGTGKTSAALCLLDRLAGAGRGLYFDAGDLARTASDALLGRLERDGRLVSWSAFWDAVGRTALVVLDDLGARDRVSDHAFDCLKRVLDLREGLPLVAITNCSLRELQQIYDDRIASRLAAGTVFQVVGEDRRLRRGSL